MKTQKGVITKINSQKTVVVNVPWTVTAQKYGKIMRKNKKLLVDAGDFTPKEGMEITISEVRPISKRKHWKIIKNI